MPSIHPHKKHKVTIQLELSSEDLVRLRQNSIERVLNNAIRCGGWIEEHLDGGSKMSNEEQDLAEAGSTLWQDCEELKPLVGLLWLTVREQTWSIKDEEL